MKINREELLKILEIVYKGVSKSSSLEGLTYFMFNKDYVYSYDNEKSIRCELKTDFDGFIKAKSLIDLLNIVSSNEIELVSNKDKLIIKTILQKENVKKSTTSFSIVKDSEIKNRIKRVDKSLKKCKWLELPKNFFDAINLCSFAASKNNSSGTLNCLFLNNLEILSMDNIRAAKAVLSSSIEKMFLKVNVIPDLISISPNYYYISKSWIHFLNKEKNCILSVRNIIGEFPSINKFFKVKGKSVSLSKDMIEGLDISTIFTDNETPNVTVTLKDNQCLLSVEKTDGTGNTKFETQIDYNSKERIDFKINPYFLKEMLKYNVNVVIKESVILIESENFKTITALYKN